MYNQKKNNNKNNHKYNKNQHQQEKQIVEHSKNRKEREYQTFSQHAKKDAEMRLNIFLDLLDLQAQIEETGKGYVIDRKGKSFGTITFSKPETLKMRCSCKNGYIKSDIQVNGSIRPGIIPFNIQNKKGEYKGLIIRSQSHLNKMLGLKLEHIQEGSVLEKIECSYGGSYFKYQDYETKEVIAFTSSYPGYGLTFISREKCEQEEKEIIICADIDNQEIGKIYIRNCLTNEELDTQEYFDKIDLTKPITEQMITAIDLICPNAYQRIDYAINSYNYPGINLVKKAIEETSIKNMTKDELNMCFGKENVKKLINKN